jgi:hypothetical protein
MSQEKTKSSTLQLCRSASSVEANSGADAGHECVLGATVASTVVSMLLAFAAPAIAYEQSASQSDIATGDSASQQRGQTSPWKLPVCWSAAHPK